MNLDAIKARLGSVSPAIKAKIYHLSPSAHRLLDDIKLLIAEVECLRALVKDE